MNRSSSKDPLGPLELAVKSVLALAVVFALVVAFSPLVGGHPVLGAWGDAHPCVSVPRAGLRISDAGNAYGIVNLRSGVHLGAPARFTLCQPAMSSGTRAFFSVPPLVALGWFGGFLILALRLIRHARRHGLFTRQVATVASGLGWFIVAGTLLVAVVHAAGFALGTSRLVHDYGVVGGFVNNIEVNWAALIAGAAALSIGRVMRQTVEMREEIEATV